MIDYKQIFHSLPGSFVLIDCDPPYYTILDASEKHLHNIKIPKEQLVGKSIFTTFYTPPKETKSVSNAGLVKEILDDVVTNKRTIISRIMRYDIPINNTAEFEVRYWKLDFYPFLNQGKEVEVILMEPMDITEMVQNGMLADKKFVG